MAKVPQWKQDFDVTRKVVSHGQSYGDAMRTIARHPLSKHMTARRAHNALANHGIISHDNTFRPDRWKKQAGGGFSGQDDAILGTKAGRAGGHAGRGLQPTYGV
jgi:hypothetical protein